MDGGRTESFNPCFFGLFCNHTLTSARGHGLKRFNPCFFGLFCNLRRYLLTSSRCYTFQSLFFWTFLQRGRRGIMTINNNVSILVFLDFSATNVRRNKPELAIQFQSLFFWTFLQHEKRWKACWRRGRFQSLFFWTFLQPAVSVTAGTAAVCFNPCFFGLFCNMATHERAGVNSPVSILVFLDFSATNYKEKCECPHLGKVSILVFLDFSAT